ncbi:TBC domain-containing protein [Cardiosporidium cionae]|uniref:TBC domain-containing protein n=1 Tax=Cardiosporidium cionae TaxID=476202 RepID=A0ABQ7JBJ5_9APIC|nr:TBC domain-containing protein [Cardiosporidium cionae]|eukprot:KAF8821329.1 TBC domain-containing protein [Cardiosporidium cionae]
MKETTAMRSMITAEAEGNATNFVEMPPPLSEHSLLEENKRLQSEIQLLNRQKQASSEVFTQIIREYEDKINKYKQEKDIYTRNDSFQFMKELSSPMPTVSNSTKLWHSSKVKRNFFNSGNSFRFYLPSAIKKNKNDYQIWESHILPLIEGGIKTRFLESHISFQSIPVDLREKLWSAAIGNALQFSTILFDLLTTRSEHVERQLSKSNSDFSSSQKLFEESVHSVLLQLPHNIASAVSSVDTLSKNLPSNQTSFVSEKSDASSTNRHLEECLSPLGPPVAETTKCLTVAEEIFQGEKKSLQVTVDSLKLIFDPTALTTLQELEESKGFTWESCIMDSFKDIHMDIYRSLHWIIMFCQSHFPTTKEKDFSTVVSLAELCRKIQRSLERFVMFRPDIGYVQGMTCLFAVLLIFMDEYKTFVSFCNLFQKPLFKSLYTFDQAVLTLYFRTFDLMLFEKLPLIYTKFNSFNIRVDYFLVDWFYTLFCRILPSKIVTHVCDRIFILGEWIFLQVSLTIVKIFDEELLTGTPEECLSLLAPSRNTYTKINEKVFLEKLQSLHITESYVNSIFQHIRWHSNRLSSSLSATFSANQFSEMRQSSFEGDFVASFPYTDTEAIPSSVAATTSSLMKDLPRNTVPPLSHSITPTMLRQEDSTASHLATGKKIPSDPPTFQVLPIKAARKRFFFLRTSRSMPSEADVPPVLKPTDLPSIKRASPPNYSVKEGSSHLENAPCLTLETDVLHATDASLTLLSIPTLTECEYETSFASPLSDATAPMESANDAEVIEVAETAT